MKVSRKILLGYSTLVLLMVLGIGYELVVINRLQAINNRLSEASFQSGEQATRLGENLRDVEEFTEKYLLIDDPRYALQLEGSRVSFDASLNAMLDTVGSDSERQALARLRSTWVEFQGALDEVQAGLPAGGRDFLPVRLEDQLRQMRVQVDTIVQEIRDTVESEVVRSARAGRQAQTFSWVVAATAVVLATGLVLSLNRSIQSSFESLMGATASVAKGEFDKRLPEARRDEFGELARSFNTMAARLDELDRLKKDFVSSVSHELKSPIASSREIVQVLLDEVPGPINDEQRRLLKLSIRSSKRLSAMVGGLLDLARMDAGTMRYDMESSGEVGVLNPGGVRGCGSGARPRDRIRPRGG
jgi:signal transduction histidine kinase